MTSFSLPSLLLMSCLEVRYDSACINESIMSAHSNCILHPHISLLVPVNFSVRTWQLLRHSRTSAFTSLMRTRGREKEAAKER